LDYLIVLILIIGSGFFSGLTIALMSLDIEILKKIMYTGGKGDSSYTALDSENAQRVLSTTSDKRKLVVTLLLGNTAVNASLSIFLGNVVGEGIMAGIVSTILIVIFGEILPVVFLTRYALYIGAKVAPLVNFLLLILTPLSWGLVYALNKLVKDDDFKLTSRTEMLHDLRELKNNPHSDFDELDYNIVDGALNLKNIPLEDIMTPRNEVYRLNYDAILTNELVEDIKSKGYTRIPVFIDENQEIYKGIFNVKDLINEPFDGKPVSDYVKYKLIELKPDMMTDDAISHFLKCINKDNKTGHLAIISNGKYWEGIVTLEDILEEIINQEITDEYDHSDKSSSDSIENGLLVIEEYGNETNLVKQN